MAVRTWLVAVASQVLLGAQWRPTVAALLVLRGVRGVAVARERQTEMSHVEDSFRRKVMVWSCGLRELVRKDDMTVLDVLKTRTDNWNSSTVDIWPLYQIRWVCGEKSLVFDA